MFAKIKTRPDLALYIIGCLLVLSLFSACTQKAPPLPPGSSNSPEAVVKPQIPTPTGDQPSGETPSAESRVENPPITVKPEEAGESIVIKITDSKDESSADATFLFGAMKIKAAKEENASVKKGVDLTCSQQEDKTTACEVTIELTSGTVVDGARVIDLGDADAAMTGKYPTEGKTSDLYVDLTSLPAFANYVLKGDDAKKLFETLTAKEVPLTTEGFESQVKKSGTHAYCFKQVPLTGGKPGELQYICYISFDPTNGQLIQQTKIK